MNTATQDVKYRQSLMSAFSAADHLYMMESIETVKETGVNAMRVYGVSKMAAELIVDGVAVDFEN